MNSTQNEMKTDALSQILDRPVNLGCWSDEPTLRQMIEIYYDSHLHTTEASTLIERYISVLSESLK